MVLSLTLLQVGISSLGGKCSALSMAVFFINGDITAALEQDARTASVFKGNCKGDFVVETELVNIKSCTVNQP